MKEPTDLQDHSHFPPPVDYPKIRYVDAFPITTEQGEAICIYDPLKIAVNALALPPLVFYLVSLFDGSHSLREIREQFQKEFHQDLPEETLGKIVKQLDSEYYLESETFHRAYQQTVEAFRQSPVRSPTHAGTAYAVDPGELDTQLGSYFEALGDLSSPETSSPSTRLSLLIAPHIDIRRGGLGFATAFQEIRRLPPSDLYVILGTGHQCRTSLLAATRKHYQTPLGRVETDVDFVERFSQESPLNVFEEEFMHRDEHSVEFQTLFLRYILGESWQGKIVPLLCGSFHPYVRQGISPRSDAKLAQTLDLLRAMILDYPGHVTLIAGVDLSHIGKRFGHAAGIPPEELERVTGDDRRVLDAIQTGEAERFYRSIENQKDCNNVCGLSPIYMCLDVVRPGRGYLLHYNQAVEPDTESVVTFASLAFYQDT